MTRKYDYLVIGSGIAGMSFALKVASKGRVALVCKTTLDEANTALAQGGVASVTNLEVDDFDKHINDTMIAGDWLSDPEAVTKVVTGAPDQIRELIRWGVEFDKKADGSFDLHREGGHSEFRILHHADNTGFEIQESLIEAVRANENIDIFEHHFAIEIITQHHLGKIVTRRTPDITCYGAYVLDTETGRVDTFLSRITLMATGGVGAVYRTTTNPLVATGDGIAMVYRAKGTVKDMEFIQFHPTALYHPGDRPSFLITEAMRGYGAVLRNLKGEEFMHKYDPRLSLAPRDIVARAIDSEMKLTGDDHVYLDVTHKDPEETKKHFPNIYAKCLSLGIDITKDYIPVAPAAHYLCGGIKVDGNAESSIKRLYAVGECSCTGLHGGNRLASNSLIEAVVYADAAARHAVENAPDYDFRTDVPEWNDEGTRHPEEMVLITQSIKEVNQIMGTYVGIVRSNLRLDRAWNRLDILYEETEKLFKQSKASREICELRNIINVGYLIMRQAKERKESRGLHYTVDYPPVPHGPVKVTEPMAEAAVL
ncbi:MAG: L-aspartate oxidase [Bacteroides sp.]|nr:L-aspartate oxidase [Bacteroides sp.]